jgi:hypothetical protein
VIPVRKWLVKAQAWLLTTGSIDNPRANLTNVILSQHVFKSKEGWRERK